VKFICEYFLKVQGKDGSWSEKNLGMSQFFHKPSMEFPLDRKAFLIGSLEQKTATRLVITQI
jgi:hypothetical protein